MLQVIFYVPGLSPCLLHVCSRARTQQSCGARLLGFASVACQAGDHRWVIFSIVYLVLRCLLRCLIVRGRLEVSKDAELLCCDMRTRCCAVRPAGSGTSRATGCGSQRCPA